MSELTVHQIAAWIRDIKHDAASQIPFHDAVGDEKYLIFYFYIIDYFRGQVLSDPNRESSKAVRKLILAKELDNVIYVGYTL